jgi:hypothetical protein
LEGYKSSNRGAEQQSVVENRGIALALLGDADGALSALEAIFATDKSNWWWYTKRHEFDYERLEAQPRFQSIMKQYQDNVAKQSALLAEMRRAGEVPYRPAQTATTSRN